MAVGSRPLRANSHNFTYKTIKKGMDVTLDALLHSRDNRHLMHLELLKQHPERSLVSVTIVMPGPSKRNAISIALADKAERFFRHCQKLQAEHLTRRDLDTGPEIYIISRLPLMEAKRLCCRIEDEHPLGRLWDLDVIRPDSVPMSRTEIGQSPRRCILCEDQHAINCIRARRHAIPDLYHRVEEIFEQFQHTPDDYDL